MQKRTKKTYITPKRQSLPSTHKDELTLDTLLIPEVYISNKFIRFMKRSVGSSFKFFPAFHKRLEDNAYSGKNLKDAIKARLNLSKK